MRSIIKNKRGNVDYLFMTIVFIMAIIAIPFIAALCIAAANIFWQPATEAIEGIGMVDSVNVTDAARMSFGTMSTILTNAKWILGVIMILMITSIVAFAMVIRFNPNPLWIAAFILIALLLIIISILFSNIYEDLYNTNDEVGAQLRSMTMVSWLIIHLPLILSVMTFVGGIIMFTGLNQEEATYGGYM